MADLVRKSESQRLRSLRRILTLREAVTETKQQHIFDEPRMGGAQRESKSASKGKPLD